MEVKVGKTSGFCYGVTNAVNKANIELEKHKGQDIYCLGELIHNKTVLEDLENKGLKIIENLDEAEKICIGRAHGVSKQDYEKAKNNGIELIDLTCPSVLKIHKIAEQYTQNNYYIFLIGEKCHPEIIATKSFCGENVSIISDFDDLDMAMEDLKKTGLKNLLVIEQTTYNIKKFEELEESIKEKTPEDINLEIKNTICLATEKRQEETKQLSKEVELMIIVGGKHSSNTNKLYEIAKENCKNAIFVESKDEIDFDEVLKFNSVGIMAGASTPKKCVDEIVEMLL